MTEPRILLVNPPLVGGVAFTRQGRCQEREEVLGTTKPPYSLLVIAALLREKGVQLRLVDLTAEERSTESLIGELRRSGFVPTLVLFPSTTPTLAADVVEMAKLKAAFGAALVCVRSARLDRPARIDGARPASGRDAGRRAGGHGRRAGDQART